MGFRNPITTAEDPTARAAASAAQTAANNAQSTANTAQTAAANAAAAASTAQTTAAAKNTIYAGGQAPTAPAGGFTVNDQWIDTSSGLAVLKLWNGSAWAAEALQASEVDTRSSSTSAGVRIYEGSDPNGVFGVVEFPDGISGDLPAQIVSRANITQQSGTLAGGSMTVQGGQWNALQSPGHVYAVESAPTAGYWRVLRLQNVDFVAPLVGPTALPLGANFAIYAGGFKAPEYRLLQSGLVVVEGLVKVTNVSFSAGAVIGTLPAGCRPASTLSFALPGFNNRAYRADVHSDGTITWQAYLASDGSVAVGSYLSLDGIHFAAEQ